MGEKAKFLYNHQTEYKHDDLNKIGATTDLTLRTITAPAAGTTNYVRKFGKQLSITGCTAIDNPTANMTIKVYALDGTLLGSRVNGGAFVAGSACTAQGVYIEVSSAGGAGTLAATESITLTGLGALVVNFPAETIADGSSMNFYLAESGSTYYDTGMMYGGARHTPVLGSEQFAYFHPEAADTALGVRTIVHVLDSCYYQIDEYIITNVDTIWQAALGETPRLVTVIGTSEYRDIEHDGSNVDTAYVCKIGNDGAATGTYQDPYLTHSHAFTNRGARTYINTMDSKSYNESFTISANMTLEPIYGKVPIITYDSVVTANFTLTAATINIYGYEFDGNNIITYGIYQNNAALDFLGNIKYNICINYNHGILNICNSFNGNISNNKITNCASISLYIKNDANSNGNILNNETYNNNYLGMLYSVAGGTSTVKIKNNKSYNNVQTGLNVQSLAGATYNGIIENNLFYENNSQGFLFTYNGAFGGNIRNMICWGNGTFDVMKSGGGAITIDNTNYETNSGFTIGAGCITTDPKFCKTTLPYKLGIASISGAYHTDSTGNNMGVRTFGLNITADDVVINGFIFDGLANYIHGLIITSNTDYTGLDIKWCRFKDFQGIEVDLWDNGTNLDADISNCIFGNGGQGLALAYGGNTITECLFYKNSKINIWLDQSGHTINHCVIYNSEYGLYVDSNGGGIICKNSIIAENSIYGIYSEIAMAIIYCCIMDAVTSNADYTDSNNKTDNSLFINTDTGTEDFHIKVAEIGYNIESTCKKAADDGYDIGAWLVDYAVLNDSWEKYVLEYNPHNMNELKKRKGGLQNEDAQGNYSSWSKARRIQLPFDFSGIMGDENQRIMLQHFAEREQGRELEYTEVECEFLVSLLPNNYLGQGSAAIDATAKTLTDSSQTWPIYNIHKGRFCTVIFNSQISGNVDAAVKTVTKVGAAWTVNEWTDYYFPYDGFYYYILSNTATVLTLSDPNGTLIDNANFDFNITKQFKIQKSNKTVLTLRDNDSELISGNYDFYIDYILCNVIGADFGYKQNQYNYENEETKQDYAITFEEIN